MRKRCTQSFGPSQCLANSQGVLTLDFLFAFLMVMGMTSLFIALTMMLSVVEVIQYMTFSSARVYFAGHFSEEDQRTGATNKFSQLSENSAIKPLVANGWFEVKNLEIGNFNQEYASSGEKDIFWGVRVQFLAPVMDMRVPIIGSTSDDGEDGFTARIQSFVSREPNMDECQRFNQERWQAIRNLDSKYSQGNVPNTPLATAIADNGC